MNGYDLRDDIAAVATGGLGAIAVIRCSGVHCIEKVANVFSSPKKLLAAAGNTIIFGWIIDKAYNHTFSKNDLLVKKNKEISQKNNIDAAENSQDNITKIDQVLVSVFRAPHSYDGEDMVEISCHGGGATIRAVMQVLFSNGFRQACRGEFTLRAFCNKKMDLTQVESVAEIIASVTDGARKNALNRLQGDLFKKIDESKKLLIDSIASIEVAVEYPEDTSTALDTKYNNAGRDKMLAARDILLRLLNSWATQRLFQTGVKIAILGKTNAGKSSLFNALLKSERAIVSDTAGTTRDYIESLVDIAGIPVRLFDTAGLRETDNDIETIGIEKSMELAKESDIVLYVIDSTKDSDDFDKSFLNICKIPVIVIFNKCDISKINNTEGINISVKNATGFDKLISAIKNAIYNNGDLINNSQYLNKEGTFTNVPSDNKSVKGVYSKIFDKQENDVGLGTQRQKVLISEALDSLNHAISVMDVMCDAAIEDLSDAIMSLGEVTGEVTSDDILENIFSNFCVGK